MYILLSAVYRTVLPVNKLVVGNGVVVQTSMDAKEAAVGVYAACGLTHALPRQIYNPPSVVLYTCCPFAVPFADKLDTNATVAAPVAFDVRELKTFVKFVNDVTFTVANALFNAFKLTGITFESAFASPVKYTGETFAKALFNAPKLIGTTFARAFAKLPKYTGDTLARALFNAPKFTAVTFAS